MNFKKVVLNVKKRLEEGNEYGHTNICCICPFQPQDCVEALVKELKKRKINDRPFRVNVERPYSFFDCTRAYETLHKTLFRNIKI
jgi:hypothetical protein